MKSLFITWLIMMDTLPKDFLHVPTWLLLEQCYIKTLVMVIVHVH